jgi:hypothetical protein
VGVDAEEASYDLLRGGRACDSAGKHYALGVGGKHLIGKVRTRMGRGTGDAWGGIRVKLPSTTGEGKSTPAQVSYHGPVCLRSSSHRGLERRGGLPG